MVFVVLMMLLSLLLLLVPAVVLIESSQCFHLSPHAPQFTSGPFEGRSYRAQASVGEAVLLLLLLLLLLLPPVLTGTQGLFCAETLADDADLEHADDGGHNGST